MLKGTGDLNISVVFLYDLGEKHGEPLFAFGCRAAFDGAMVTG